MPEKKRAAQLTLTQVTEPIDRLPSSTEQELRDALAELLFAAAAGLDEGKEDVDDPA